MPEYTVGHRSACLSPCDAYRYTLERTVTKHVEESTCTFVMLNPSTADADLDDPTIRRCMGFAFGWGYDRLIVVNLYAFRATQPADLWKAEDPVGPENAKWLRLATKCAGRVVLAWGAHGKRNGRGQAAEDAIREGLETWTEIGTLGRTKGGEPKHPLYLRADTEFRP